MAKDPAFLFYPSDYLVGTFLFDFAQKGKYMDILCMLHSKGGYLSEKEIKKILDFNDPSDIEILNKFKKTSDGYFNQRLLNEIDKRKKHSQQQKENVMKRWDKEKKGNEEDTTVLPNGYDGNTKTIPLENENRNTNKNIIKNSNDLYNTIILYWNENSNLAKVLKLSDARKKLLNARLQDFSKEKILEMIDIVSKSDFLQGRKNDWKANFDWCFNVNNFIKIIEGNYNNITNGNKQDSKVIVEPGSQLEKDLERYEKNKIVIE